MSIDDAAVAALGDRTIGPEHKGMPPASWGSTVREFLSTAPTLGQLQTPMFTVDRGAVATNISVMADWAHAAGVRLAPHGKTTMAPRLWADQLAAGSWGITVATVWQAQVARAFGVARVLLANTLVDPVGLRWVVAEIMHDSSFEFFCWADSVETVALMDAHLHGAPGSARIPVLVELGAPGGRTGARTVDEAAAVARAIAGASRLTLAGVGGYEGVLAYERSPKGVAAVEDYLGQLARLHRELADAGVYRGAAILTAGGSTYPDLVVEHLAPLADEHGARGVATTVVLRSGAYVIHDDGFYAAVSPLALPNAVTPLRAAMHGWARVLSCPEPGLALLDAGRRDLPFDAGLPVPQLVVGEGSEPLVGATVSALNDQHAFLRLPPSAASTLQIGAVVRLGLSHPCTAFDKWRLIPVVDDADAPAPKVVDVLHTFF
ncbi:amino acid deaminase [Nocardia sp. CNY236]|uniref:amino acid deaminase n=1 Tax=Nocardia sp. CNY236 TaxID=1169152 RepID=UPI0004081944|nr:amino acid deaminase [Nocardia sp. CNY236]